MSVRKELLERELKKLGFRKAGPGAHDGGSVQQQQQPQHSQPEGHPQADGGPGDGRSE